MSLKKFRQDNIEGFSDKQLAVLNDEYFRELAAAFADLPNGLEGADDDLIQQIEKSVASDVLNRAGAVEG